MMEVLEHVSQFGACVYITCVQAPTPFVLFGSEVYG